MKTATLNRYVGRISKAAKSVDRSVERLNKLYPEEYSKAVGEYVTELLRPDDRVLDAAAKTVEATSSVFKVFVGYFEDHLDSMRESTKRMREKRDAEGRYTMGEVSMAVMFEDAKRHKANTSEEDTSESFQAEAN